MKKLFLCVLATALSIMSCSSARSTDANLKDSVNAYSEISKKLDSIEQQTKKIAEMQNTIEQLKDSLINEVDKYICSVAPRSKMTADNIVNQCFDTEYDISLLLSQAHLETRFGSCGNHNVFGIVGKRYKHPDHAVSDYIKLMTSKYIIDRTPEELIHSNFSMEKNRKAKYAANPKYGKEIGAIRKNIINNTDIHSIWTDMLDIQKQLSEFSV